MSVVPLSARDCVRCVRCRSCILIRALPLIPRKDGVSALVAVKSFRFPNRYDSCTINRKISREIGILKLLHHDNIVPLWGIATGFGPMPELRCLVSPWMPNGTLNDYLASNHNNLTDLDRSRMLEDVSAGLHYLHSVPVMHGDITGANILIDEGGHARLIDFGLSTIIQPLLGQSHLAATSIRPGAIRYAAPELVRSDGVHDRGSLEKTDIYSFGCVMLQVLSGRPPWSEVITGRLDVRITVMILEGHGPKRPHGHPAIIDLDWSFIQKCLRSEPEFRPSAEEVLDFTMHRFYSPDSLRLADDPPDDAQDGSLGALPHDVSEGWVVTDQPPNSPPSYPGRALKLKTVTTAMSWLELFSSGSSSLRGGVSASTRQEEAIPKVMNDHLDNPPLRRFGGVSASTHQAEDAIRQSIHAQLDTAPLRLLDTYSGIVCSRDAQIEAFMEEHEELLGSLEMHALLQMEPIKEAVAKFFRWVMSSHRWESREPLLYDVQDKSIYALNRVGTPVKLQKFCQVARDAGYRWAWVDTCCIDQNNNVELQRTVNSMFVWYRSSALTIVYLSDVPPASKSGALANSAWNTRGWTLPELLAPKVLLFYQSDWTLYLDNHSSNHKESALIMQELEAATGINARTLVTFRPGMRGVREKLQWASSRVTSVQEDIAYSLFGIFGIYLPVIYGEKKQNALGRLLQEIIARSGDISALDWVGESSDFNSCLPADITSYKAPPYMLSSLSEDEMQTLVSKLRSTTTMESASKLYNLLDNLSAPRFANRRLHLPCITFTVAKVRRRGGRDQETCFTYDIKADGLQDMRITTEDKLVEFSPGRPTRQRFLLVRPWNRADLELPDFLDKIDNQSEPESPSRELRLIVRLGQSFGALLLAQQRDGEYKRIASDQHIIAQVKDTATLDDMMDIRTLEIL